MFQDINVCTSVSQLIDIYIYLYGPFNHLEGFTPAAVRLRCKSSTAAQQSILLIILVPFGLAIARPHAP